MKFRHASPTYTYHSGKVVSAKYSLHSDPREFSLSNVSHYMVLTYLELPYPFESYSIGVDVVLAERGIPADALVEAVLAGAGSADGSSA